MGNAWGQDADDIDTEVGNKRQKKAKIGGKGGQLSPEDKQNILRKIKSSDSLVSSHGIFEHAHTRANKVRKKIGAYDYKDDKFDFENFEVQVTSNNSYYQGQTNKDDDPQGKGVMVYNDGAIYEGHFEDGHWEGKGRLIHSSGDIYEGDWEENKAQGKGKFTTLDGTIYNGGWEADKKQGKGVETWPDGTR
jgi:hypothetical protein